MKAVDKHNEITVKVTKKLEGIEKQLKNKEFQQINQYHMLDYYFVPNHLDLKEMRNREILSYAVLIRSVAFLGQEEMKFLVVKKKEIEENGEIKKQEIVNCSIYKIQEAKNLLQALGYKEIMRIEENGFVWRKEDFQLVVKEVIGGDILIEVETTENEKYDTIEKIKQKLVSLDLTIDKSDFFVKKAEIELERRK